MQFAAPWLILFGGILVGLLFHAFSRHHFLGWLTLIAAGTLIFLGFSGNSVTIPRQVIVNPPSHSASPSPSHS